MIEITRNKNGEFLVGGIEVTRDSLSESESYNILTGKDIHISMMDMFHTSGLEMFERLAKSVEGYEDTYFPVLKEEAEVILFPGDSDRELVCESIQKEHGTRDSENDLKRETLELLDALETAEMALADIETGISKGYVDLAREQLFGITDRLMNGDLPELRKLKEESS